MKDGRREKRRGGTGSAGRKKLRTETAIQRTKYIDEEAFKDPQTYKFLNEKQLSDLESLAPKAVFKKIADYVGLKNWKLDLKHNLMVSFHFNNYIFAMDSKFTNVQVSTFCSIMKSIIDICIEKDVARDDLYHLFTEIMTMHSDASMTDDMYEPDSAWDVFGPKEVQLITDYALSSVFQHYKMYKKCFAQDQDKELLQVNIHLETIPEAPSLSEAIPMEVYEAEQKKKAEEEALVKAEQELITLETQAKIVNPFEALDIASVKQITADTIKSVIMELGHEFEKAFEEQREKFTSNILRLAHFKDAAQERATSS